MASTDFVYSKARIAIGSKQIDLTSATVNAMLVSNAYSPQPQADQYVSAIPAGAIVIRDLAITGQGLSANGSFYGNLALLNSFISSLTVVAIILYVQTGNDATSQLLYYSSTGPGFPFQPLGFSYAITYDQVSGGYFQA
ncbi:MAG: hypothetical protein ACHQ9S_18855 [Candidatus Binatia bacterium]